MRRTPVLLLLTALLALAGCGGSSPPPAAGPPRAGSPATPVYCLGQPAPAGTVPIVVLAGNGSNLWDPAWDADAALAAARARAGRPFLAGFWCNHPGAPGSTLVAWPDDAGWELLLAHARRVAADPQVLGLCFDGELYSETPRNNGGTMSPRAWPPGGAARARQLREAVGPKLLAQYVCVADARAHPGWREFWGAAYRKGDLLLDETYVCARTSAFTDQGVRNLEGRYRYTGGGGYWVYLP